MVDEERDEPQEEEVPAEAAEGEEQPAEEEPAAEEEPVAEEEPAPEEQPAAEEEPAAPPAREPAAEGRKRDEAIPGAHLEPDLVLEEEEEQQQAEFGYETPAEEAEAPAEPTEERPERPDEPAPARSPLELAADARYRATGKRKSSVARVVLKPGSGEYRVNGRPLDEYFPRPALQKMARQPLETAGYESRMDVAARIHGGGVASQAGALRHGVTRALVEADPGLRLELKRRGFLTRDARVKERKKAGLKKARKRPQFSKR